MVAEEKILLSNCFDHTGLRLSMLAVLYRKGKTFH